MKQILLYAIILTALVACAFPRDNPLDPENTGIPAPPRVTNLKARGFSNPPRITLEWDALTLADGYYIYRAGHLDGNYRRLAEVVAIPTPAYIDTDDLRPNQFYYYRVSAYRIIDDDLKLEGELSEYDVTQF